MQQEMREIPIFRPTLEEFEDPYAYLRSIAAEGAKYLVPDCSPLFLLLPFHFYLFPASFLSFRLFPDVREESGDGNGIAGGTVRADGKGIEGK